MSRSLTSRSGRGRGVRCRRWESGILGAGLCAAAWPLAGPAAEAPDASRFEAEILAEGMTQPLELEVAPDGRVFFIELGGRIKVWLPESGEVEEAGKLEVFAEQENGLIGMALDPAFAGRGWIYLQYSPRDYAGQQISRFTVDGNRLDPGSERRLLRFPEQREDCCHHAGSMEFGPDGCLYIATGDNTHPAGDSAGYAPLDERPGRGPYDAQKSSANAADLRGKILRIRPTPEGGYAIPEGNLFPADGSGGSPEIYVMGCRNPWRIQVDPLSGWLYWGEVGPDAGGDGPRGPRGYDEINQARGPGNFGWPYFIAGNRAYHAHDFATGTTGPAFDPARPVNDSPRNTGPRELPPAQAAWIAYPYGASEQWPELGSGGRTACAGPVYRFREEFRDRDGFPEYYDGCVLIYDWQRPFIRWVRLDAGGAPAALEPFWAGFSIRRPVDFDFAEDGVLYLLDYGETWGANADARLARIRYRRGNRPPRAVASAEGNAGRAPLRVRFSAAGSSDPDSGEVLRFRWTVRPEGRVLGEGAVLESAFSADGVYQVDLEVRDGVGAAAAASVPVLVGNAPPEVAFAEPGADGFVDFANALPFRVKVTDAEDGDSEKDAEVLAAGVSVTARFPAGVSGEAEEPAGLRLMRGSDCFNCHAIGNRIAGPALLEVAARYAGDAEALERSAGRVMAGSSGVWGGVPMLPHPQHSAEEARRMVEWILALREENTPGLFVARGLEGVVPVPEAVGSLGGFCLLEAVYTDRGGGPVGPLAERVQRRLRSRLAQAEAADGREGGQILEDASAQGGRFFGAVAHGGWLRFSSLPLGETGGISCRVAGAGPGAMIEVRVGRPDGPLLAAVEAAPTGAWDKWEDVAAGWPAPAGSADVYLIFVRPGGQHLLNLDSVTFLAPER